MQVGLENTQIEEFVPGVFSKSLVEDCFRFGCVALFDEMVDVESPDSADTFHFWIFDAFLQEIRENVNGSMCGLLIMLSPDHPGPELKSRLVSLGEATELVRSVSTTDIYLEMVASKVLLR